MGTDRYTNTAKQRDSPLLDQATSWCQLLIFSNDRSSEIVLTTAGDNSTNTYSPKWPRQLFWSDSFWFWDLSRNSFVPILQALQI